MRGFATAIFTAVLLACIVSFAYAWTLYFQKPTYYTDNVTVIPDNVVLSYNLKMNGVTHGPIDCKPNAQGICTWPIPDSLLGHKSQDFFEMQTIADGVESAWTTYYWANPKAPDFRIHIVE